VKNKQFRGLDIFPGAHICFAIALLLVPVQWIVAWVIAVIIHELCHLGMILLTGCSVDSINIGVNGAEINTHAMPAWKEILCAAAGPVGSLLPLLAVKQFPEVAICGLLQAAWNLIPLYPLDGGRVINCLVTLLFPRSAERIIKWIRVTVFCLIVIIGIYAVFWFKAGICAVVLLVVLGIKTGVIKYPCKQCHLRVQ